MSIYVDLVVDFLNRSVDKFRLVPDLLVQVKQGAKLNGTKRGSVRGTTFIFEPHPPKNEKAKFEFKQNLGMWSLLKDRFWV